MIYNLLYHGLCMSFLVLLYYDFSGVRMHLPGSLKAVYLLTSMVILSDCWWAVMEWADYKPVFLCYAVNIIYYIAQTTGVYSWTRYSVNTLSHDPKSKKRLLFILTLPAVAVVLLALSTPFTGIFFYIENGSYVRGSLFMVDAIVKLSYLLFSIIYAFVLARKEQKQYMRKRIFLLGVFCIPVLFGGVLQALYGLDLSCVAPVLSLAIVYRFGLSNESREMENQLKAIGQAYSATFIIDTDSHSVNHLSASEELTPMAQKADGMTYETGLKALILDRVAPEDKVTVKEALSIDNLLNQFKEKGVYSLTYKILSADGHEQYNKATFLKAFGDEDRREIVLGIEELETRQVLLQQKEAHENERDEFERVKESLTSVLANIIEARDIDSGEHVLRVKTYTQFLCNSIMSDYPEYGLTPRKIRYIVQGSALHDVGKIMIPDAILLKPGKLTAEEFATMKSHCIRGCEILDRLPSDLDEEYIAYAREICRWHHEKYDGRGYPDGLVGDDIPISAQIVSLADCFDALTTPRVYKPAFTPEKAFQMITGGECGVFSEKLMRCFAKVFDQMKSIM